MNGDSSSRARACALTLLAVVVILFYRKPDAFLSPTLWAEDGTEFYRAAREEGPASLLSRYNGYFHLVPRLAALGAASLPPERVPMALNLAALAVMLMVAGSLFSRRADLAAPVLCGLALALVPHRGDVFANVTNTINVLVLSLVVLSRARPAESLGARLRDYGVLTIAGLTGPYVAFVAPLFAARAAMRRSRHDVVLLALAIGLGALQLAGLDDQRAPGTYENVPGLFWYVAAVRGAGSLLFGETIGTRLLTPPWVMGTASLVIWGGALVLGGARRRGAVVTFAVASLILQAVLLWAYRANLFHLATSFNDRYSYPILVLILWALAELRSAGGFAGACGTVVLTGALLGSFSGFQTRDEPELPWKIAAPFVGGPVAAAVPIAPSGWYYRYTPRREGRPADPLSSIRVHLSPNVRAPLPDDVAVTWLDGRTLAAAPAGQGIVADVPRGATRFSVTAAVWGGTSRRGGRVHVVAVVESGSGDPVEVARLDVDVSKGRPAARTLEGDIPAGGERRLRLVVRPEGESAPGWSGAWTRLRFAQ